MADKRKIQPLEEAAKEGGKKIVSNYADEALSSFPGAGLSSINPYANPGTQQLLSGTPEIIANGVPSTQLGPTLASAAPNMGASLGGIAAGAYTGMEQFKGLKKLGTSEDMSFTEQAALALPTFGLSLLYNPVKKFFGFGGEPTNQEEKLRESLVGKGINVANAGVKEWENNAKFKDSRSEADLVGRDIANAGQFYSNYAGYDKLDDAKKEAVGNEALRLGLVREHHGTVDVNRNEEFDKFVQAQMTPVTPSGEGGGRRREREPRERREREPSLLDIAPKTQKGERYDLNPSAILRNSYL